MRRELPCRLGTASVLVPKSPVERTYLVQHHYRRLMGLTTCSLEWDAALLAAAPSAPALLRSSRQMCTRACDDLG
jgi:hypothetical protein